jgi:hypothetical protein
VLSKSEPAVQIGQLALQRYYAVLELGIFGGQRFWNFQFVTAVAAYRGVIADIFGTKRATHTINLVSLVVHHIESENQVSGAALFIFDVGADDVRAGRDLGLGHINAIRFSKFLDAVRQIDRWILDVRELQ